MPTTRLTAQSVARLPPPEVGQTDYFDASFPAFGLRVTAKGVRTFILLTRINGKKARLTIGRAQTRKDGPGVSLADARRQAGEWQDQVACGRDPREEQRAAKAAAEQAQQPDPDTWDQVVERFIRQYAKPRNRSWREAERVLGKDVTPRWRGRPIREISKREVVDLVDALVEAGKPALANRVLQHIKRVMSWCVEKDILEDSPARTVKAPAKLEARDRVLTDDEIRLFWSAADRMGFPWSVPLKVLLLTGQRRSEVAEMEWSELSDLDGETPTWTIPARRAKNGVEHGVPLSPHAADLLRSVPRIQGCRYVFSTTGNSPVSGISKAKARLDGFITEMKGDPLEPWTLHDLRRTFASGAAALGVRVEVVERCLGHTSGTFRGIVSVYQRHEFGPEKRAALTAWANHINLLVQNTEADDTVVMLAEAR
ncbi:tyrosine-type recombinase/integrase [Rhodospira trueperi]|uniref:Site-specific recombinase XerD n=1 Tax=Rhodospira trueperi TaxID=69960 RepID=A0A1G7GLR9_9PROT|nr:site-specific integrase [Rhodospira trueperi]SDE89072.1 Site-specific recombinase XerD [Rhodospira trueperi]